MKLKRLHFQTLLLVFSALTIIFVSCENDDPEPEYPSGKKRITKIFVKDCNIVSESEKVNRDYYVHLEYDHQNRLIKYTEEHPGSTDVITISYSSNEVTLNMDGRDLGKYTLNDKGYAVKFERDYTKPCTYEYDDNDYLIKSSNGEKTNTYEYSNGNLVSWTDGNTSGTLVPSSIEDKMNGATYYHFLRLVIHGYAEVTPAYIAGLFGKTPPYLPQSGEHVYTLGEKRTTRQLAITYEFDKDGYVTRQIENYVSGGGSASTIGDMTMEYEEIP